MQYPEASETAGTEISVNERVGCMVKFGRQAGKSKYEKVLSPINIYLFFSLLGIILFFIAAFFKRQRIFDWVVMENNSYWAMLDYFRHIRYSQYFGDMYRTIGGDACFPPLAYMFYYFVCRITSIGFIENETKEIPYLPYQMIIYVMYLIVGTVWLIYVIEELKISKLQKKLLLFSILFSVPMFMGAIERGNMALYVIVMLLNVIIWKNSGIKWKQEAALVLIALASGLKVYPAIFGLLYIKERRWKEAGRLILYGVGIFLLPFVFYGKWEGVLAYWNILIGKMSGDFNGRVQFFKGLLGFLSISGHWAMILNLIFMCMLLLGILFTRDKIREMTYLAAFMALVPANAYRYTLIYFLLAVFQLIEIKSSKRTDDYVGAVMMGCLFSIPTIFGWITDFELNFGLYTYTYVERYIYTIAWSFLGYQIVREGMYWIKYFSRHDKIKEKRLLV